jgi:hypothetical protein
MKPPRSSNSPFDKTLLPILPNGNIIYTNDFALLSLKQSDKTTNVFSVLLTFVQDVVSSIICKTSYFAQKRQRTGLPAPNSRKSISALK